LEEVVQVVDQWLEQPNLRLLAPEDQHWLLVRRLLIEGQAWGPLASEAQLAALTIENGGVLQDRDFAVLGRKFENHNFFPRRVNTEFILPISRNRMRMRVWERGSGETWACGTGACAAVVAAVLTNRSERVATVELRGGNLEIEWRAGGPHADHVFMTGNAVEVFRGEIELGDTEMIPVGA